jgi:hypothetical protein
MFTFPHNCPVPWYMYTSDECLYLGMFIPMMNEFLISISVKLGTLSMKPQIHNGSNFVRLVVISCEVFVKFRKQLKLCCWYSGQYGGCAASVVWRLVNTSHAKNYFYSVNPSDLLFSLFGVLSWHIELIVVPFWKRACSYTMLTC